MKKPLCATWIFYFWGVIIGSGTGLSFVQYQTIKWTNVHLLYPPYPKDRGMLWFYVEAARRPQWC